MDHVPTAVDEVLELVSLLQRDMERWFERDGLTQSRAHLLWLLRDGPTTQRALADLLSVTPRNVTGLVDGLVASGHVERHPHPGDRRATLVTLTGPGTKAVGAMVQGYDELASVLFGGLSDRQLQSFRGTTRKILVRLRAAVAEDRP
jgi:DNA-binding MarR family transcriptional regulator